MPRVDVDIRWDPGYREELLRLGEPGLEQAALAVLTEMRLRIPVSHDGHHGRPAGYARSRLKVVGIHDSIGRAKEVGTDATAPDGYPYPVGLEFGTKPHTIRSHGDYPLRAADGRVFGKEVHHPGTRPRPWARPALYSIRGRTF
jgi:hypothetical protein